MPPRQTFGQSGRSRSTGNLLYQVPSLRKLNVTKTPEECFDLINQQTELKLQLKQLTEENRRFKCQLQRLQQQNQRNRHLGMSWTQINQIEQTMQQQINQIGELKQENLHLKKQNQRLKDNLLLFKIKSNGGSVNSPLTDPYEHVTARVDSGLRFNRSTVSRSKTSSQIVKKDNRTKNKESAITSSGAMSNAIMPRVSFNSEMEQRQLMSDSDAEEDARLVQSSKATMQETSDSTIDPIGLQLLKEARSEIAKLEQIVLMQQNFIETSLNRKSIEKQEADDQNEMLNFDKLSLVSDDSMNENDKPSKLNSQRSEDIDHLFKKSKLDENDKSVRKDRKETLTHDRCETPIGSLALSSTKSEMTLELANHVDQLRSELREQRKESAKLRLRLLQKEMTEGQTSGLNRELDQFKTENKILRDSLKQFSSQYLMTTTIATSNRINASEFKEDQLKRLLQALESETQH